MHRKALGKGLEALFRTESDILEEGRPSSRKILTVPLKDIMPNHEQPRERFSEEAMEDLKRSIVENGILEPPVVRRKGDFFELIAGERRYRAARELNLESIEVIVMDVEGDEKMLILSLIENIQREDLNAIEEARAYRQIIDRMDATQEDLSRIVGKSRSAVANTLRLLSLPDRIQKMISEGVLAPGSARALAPVEDPEIQYRLASKIASEGLSARKAEELVRTALTRERSAAGAKPASIFLERIREDLRRFLGTEVKIRGNESKGKIEIEYYSGDDLERIIDSFRGDGREK
jgi:ParB family transcriptional regulator, chromosome partitioning protein